MATAKGEQLEELTRQFFSQQGYFAVRAVPLRAHGNDVTDIDVLLYRRVGSTRSRICVDVKSKRSPKAFERVLWARGLQAILDFDASIVATTDTTDAVSRFASEHEVGLITRDAISTKEVVEANKARLSLEEFEAGIRAYEYQKSDGDWIQRISDGKSALLGASGFPAFNRLMLHFRFFAERVYTKPQQAEVARRCSLLCAALACIALDQAVQNIQFADAENRADFIRNGVTYGDNNFGRTKAMIGRVMTLVSSSVPNGEVIRKNVERSLAEQFEALRADIISEYFTNTARSAELVSVASTLEGAAFARSAPDFGMLPASSKAALGVFADFSTIPRQRLFQPTSSGPVASDREESKRDSREPKLL